MLPGMGRQTVDATRNERQLGRKEGWRYVVFAVTRTPAGGGVELAESGSAGEASGEHCGG